MTFRFGFVGGNPISTILASDPSANYGGDDFLSSVNYLRMGQAINLAAHTITSIEFYIKKIGIPPSSNIICAIKACSGSPGAGAVPTGSALAINSNTVDISLLNTSISRVPFTFANYGWAGGNITFELQYSGGDGSNRLAFGVDSTTRNGNRFGYATGAYAALGANDCIFYVNGF